MASPEEEHQKIMLIGECLDDGIRECLPSFAGVGHRLSCTDGECGIEEEDTLLRPAGEVAVIGQGRTDIISYFFEDVHKGRGIPYSSLDRKREPMSLPGPMIGILPEYHHLHSFEGGFVESGKYVFRMRIDGLPGGDFVSYELG